MHKVKKNIILFASACKTGGKFEEQQPRKTYGTTKTSTT